MQRFNVVERNPVVGLELTRKTLRDRYVSDDKYAFILVPVSAADVLRLVQHPEDRCFLT
jgi:hypothetical protein